MGQIAGGLNCVRTSPKLEPHHTQLRIVQFQRNSLSPGDKSDIRATDGYNSSYNETSACVLGCNQAGYS